MRFPRREVRVPKTIAIATCREYPDLVEDDLPIVTALAAAGVAAEPAVWDDEVDWDRFDAVLLRSVWDYFLHPAAFRAWLDDLDRSGIPSLNPTSLVRWNMDKRYLRDLSARGVGTVETLWIEPGNGTTAASAAAKILETGWPEVVVKPAVSAGAWRTMRLRREEIATHLAGLEEILESGGILAQPFLPEILSDGEWSLLFFGGQFSHAVVKRPKAGDFRVQWTQGGSHAAATPSPRLVSEARAALLAAPDAGLYARVDGVVREGRLLLMELEQIEPYLFLSEDAGACGRFVRALLARV